MKQLIAVLAVLFSVNSLAWTGNGNDRVEDAREYMRYANAGTGANWEVGYWQGVIAGLSAQFNQTDYQYAICYPESATLAQIAEIAARYVIDNPAERAYGLNVLVWKAHADAFGIQTDASCWLNATE